MPTRTDHRRRDGKGKVLWHVRPADVDSDGNWIFRPTGYLTPVVGQCLMPPGGDDPDDRVSVIAQQTATEQFKSCPACDAPVPEERPVFSAGEYAVYPCTVCDEWVWTWWEDGTLLERMA